MYVYGKLLKAQLEDSASDLTNANGMVYWNSSTLFVKYYDGVAWRTLVSLTGTQTLTNKILTGNTAANLISGSGTLVLNTSGTATIPNATDTLMGKATTDTMTNKTATSLVLNTGVSGSAIDTDGSLAANSDTLLASQKAVKTYVTASVSTAGGVANIRASEGAGTTTLTTADARKQIFNLSAGRTCVLPTTSIVAGDTWTLVNITTNVLTIQSSAGTALTVANSHNTFGALQKGYIVLVALQNTPTTPAHWQTIECCDEGVFTPTMVDSTNVSATTEFACTFSRDIKHVTVRGRVDVDPTVGTAGTASAYFIPLPIASNLTSSEDLIGISNGSASAGNMYQSGIITGDTTNDRARVDFNTNDASSKQHNFYFTYELK